jgi:hypothetical protein
MAPSLRRTFERTFEAYIACRASEILSLEGRTYTWEQQEINMLESDLGLNDQQLTR